MKPSEVANLFRFNKVTQIVEREGLRRGDKPIDSQAGGGIHRNCFRCVSWARSAVAIRFSDLAEQRGKKDNDFRPSAGQTQAVAVGSGTST